MGSLTLVGLRFCRVHPQGSEGKFEFAPVVVY